MDQRKICVGMFTGAHGVRGMVHLRSFTQNPDTISDYKVLVDEDGKAYELEVKSVTKDYFVTTITGVTNREQAAALKGTKLYVPRAQLPTLRKREYYETDLIGLAVTDKAGKDRGKILGVHDYGAGPFLEIGSSKEKSFMLPFTDAHVPEVDVKAGTALIDPPEGWV